MDVTYIYVTFCNFVYSKDLTNLLEDMEQQGQKVQVTCPNCGTTLLVKNTTGATERTINCPKCQTPIMVNFAPMNTPPSYPATPTPVAMQKVQQSGGSSKGVLIGALSGLVVVLAGLLVWLLVFKDKPAGSPATIDKTDMSTSMPSQASVSASAEPKWADAEFSASTATEASSSVKPEASIYENSYGYYGYFVGNVGDGQCDMHLEGATGTYTMNYDKHERRLERVSDGVYKAYFKSKYIGTFRGTINNDIYSGKFETPNRGTLKFELIDVSGD